MGLIKKLFGRELEQRDLIPKRVIGGYPISDVPPKVGVRVDQHFFGKPTPQVVTISFQVGGPEWCKLVQGDEWRNFEAVLIALQKEQEHYMH